MRDGGDAEAGLLDKDFLGGVQRPHAVAERDLAGAVGPREMADAVLDGGAKAFALGELGIEDEGGGGRIVGEPDRAKLRHLLDLRHPTEQFAGAADVIGIPSGGNGHDMRTSAENRREAGGG